MKKLLIIIAVILALAGFGIYKLVGAFGRAGERGDAVVSVFHRDYNAKSVPAMHLAATPVFRESVPLEKFTSFIGMLHDKLGEWKSGDRTGLNMKTENGHETLELTYSATFAKGSGTEEFLFDYNGDEPKLIHYNVKSPLLAGADAGVEATGGETKPANP